MGGWGAEGGGEVEGAVRSGGYTVLTSDSLRTPRDAAGVLTETHRVKLKRNNYAFLPRERKGRRKKGMKIQDSVVRTPRFLIHS